MRLLDEMNREPVKTARLAEGRHAHPTAGVIDSQSVKTTESGRFRGHHAGKKIKGRKRHIGTDTTGLRVGLEVHSAGVQDRDGAPDVLKALAARYPMLRHVFADGGSAGPKLRDALKVDQDAGLCRSSSAPIRRKALRSYPGDGWSSEPSQGWGAAAACQKLGINLSPAHRLGSSLPTFGASPAISQDPESKRVVLNQTLKQAANLS